MTERTDKIFAHARERLNANSPESSLAARAEADKLIIEEVQRLYDEVEHSFDRQDGIGVSPESDKARNLHLANANRLKQAEILYNLRTKLI